MMDCITPFNDIDPIAGEQPLNDFVQRINELYSRDV